jgi:hypothetical protein
MPNSCVKAVFCLRKNLLIIFKLSTYSTGIKKYLTSQVFYSRSLFPNFNHFLRFSTQAFNLLIGWFYTVFTGSTNTTKLIKDFNL